MYLTLNLTLTLTLLTLLTLPTLLYNPTTKYVFNMVQEFGTAVYRIANISGAFCFENDINLYKFRRAPPLNLLRVSSSEWTKMTVIIVKARRTQRRLPNGNFEKCGGAEVWSMRSLRMG